MATTPQPASTQLSDDTRKLVEDHQPVVRSVANHVGRRLPPNVDRADLVQDGMLGLMEALLRWTKESTGTHVENYMALRAHGAMIDGLRAADPVSRQVRKDMRRVEVALQQLSHRLGRPPTEGELAKQLDMPLADYQRLLPTFVMGQMPLVMQILFFGALLSAIKSTSSATLLAPTTSASTAGNICISIRPVSSDWRPRKRSRASA